MASKITITGVQVSPRIATSSSRWVKSHALTVVILLGCNNTSSTGQPPANADASDASGISTRDGGMSDRADLGSGKSDTSPSQLNCQSLVSGCSCTMTAPQIGSIATCDSSSVQVVAGQRGVCCDSATACSCKPYECKVDSSSQSCGCGEAISIDTMFSSTATLTSCPAISGQTCCNDVLAGICTCGSQNCPTSASPVPSCSTSLVAVCATGAAVSKCQ
jgi:hypothetical protein